MKIRGLWETTTNQSKQLGTLRFSLLVALGVSPLACGGTVSSSGERGKGGADPHGNTGGFAGNVVSIELGGAGGSIARPGPGGGSGGRVVSTELGGAGAGGSVVDPEFGGGGSGGSVVITEPGGGTSGGGGAGPVDVGVLCANEALDPMTHLATCQNGLVHRPQATTCALNNTAQGGAPGSGGEAGAGGKSSCNSNADCSALHLGWCEFGGPGASSVCHAGCQQDDECGPGGACQCDPTTVAGRCVYGACRLDSDCGPNSVCAQIKQVCSAPTFRCSHAGDECTTHSDCPGLAPFCGPSKAGNLVCSAGSCGRPFLVDDAARVAPVASRTDWSDASLCPSLEGLSPVQRAELAAHWARLGQMEHASIAAFARFNLQLLSLGAPAVLVEACNRALVDETRHAKQCFALASQYAGVSVGPDRLDLAQCFEDLGLQTIMKLVLDEGCIGETVAALEALEDAEAASDPVVRRVLQGIARDEQAHAELAFQFMRWALTRSSSKERAAIAIEAEQSLLNFELNAENSSRARAARHVVRPLLAEIFRHSPTAAEPSAQLSTA